MNQLSVGVTLISIDGKVEVWFHLAGQENADPRNMSESFIAGIFDNKPSAQEALTKLDGVLLTYMPEIDE